VKEERNLLCSRVAGEKEETGGGGEGRGSRLGERVTSAQESLTGLGMERNGGGGLETGDCLSV